jgi:hypothetical protein
MKRRLCLLTFALMTSCLLISVSGCDLTLGPKVKTVYTLIQPGKPLEVLESMKARGRVVGSTGDPVMQDIGGWIVMPPEHWDAIERALKELETRRAADKK